MTDTKPRASVLVAGSANVDFVVRAPHIPAPGETVLGRDLTMVAGGKGANQAVAAARAGGADTAMLVALGNDVFAPLLETSLAGAGVVLHRIRSDAPTGAALICVSDNAENAITVAPGANMSLKPGDLPDLAGTNGLLLQLETPLPTVIAYARAAHAHGIMVILNASPAQILPSELIAAIDVLVVNEDELTAIAGPHGSIAEKLVRLDVPCAVATLGAKGACAFADGEFHLQPAVAVTPVDTTAAGDTFCGVLAAALCAGDSLRAALGTACSAAGLAATRMGAQSSIPNRAEVEAVPARAKAETAALAGLAAYCGVADIPKEAGEDRI